LEKLHYTLVPDMSQLFQVLLQLRVLLTSPQLMFWEGFGCWNVKIVVLVSILLIKERREVGEEVVGGMIARMKFTLVGGRRVLS